MRNTQNPTPKTATEKLEALRSLGGARVTEGLPANLIDRFLATDTTLELAIERAWERYEEVAAEFPDLPDADESDQIDRTQECIVNF